MNTPRLFAATLLLAAVGGAWANDGLTREQVRAETRAAAAAGQIPHGDLDLVRAAPIAASTTTRAQVQVELRQAAAAGLLPVGDTDRTAADIDPARYPQATAAVGKTRTQVRAELAEALRVGDIEQGDTGRTLAEISPQRYAAARAATAQRFASN